MKLLMITGSGGSDLAQGKKGAFYNMLEEFHKYWDRIDIICPRISKSPTVPRGLTSKTLGVEPFLKEPLFGNVYSHPSPWPLWLQPFWILKNGGEIYREWKFDLMTVHEYPPFYNGIGARMLWWRVLVPYILEVMHIPGYPKAANLKERFYKSLMRFFIWYDTRRARAVRVINQRQTPEFLIQAGVPREKIRYIPAFYIDLNTFIPMAAEKQYDLVYAARLEKNKGILNLIEAVRIAKKSKPDIKLLIIGSGPEFGRIKLQAENYGLRTNIIFSGWLETLDDVARAHNSAKIFISPSLNEGGPRVVLEAMACGLPVITTPVGLAVDVIKDGDNGLFTDWEPVKMAGKILYLLNKPDLQERFSQAGLELVRQFEKKTAIKNYAQDLKNLMS